MALFSTRQSPSQPASGRATIAHLGRAQQPPRSLLSGRTAAANSGVGRRYTGSNDLLTPRQLRAPISPLPDFYRLRADAQRLQQQLAAHDRAAATPYHPLVLLAPGEQARHRHEAAAQTRQEAAQRLLAAYNQSARALYRPLFLRPSPVSLRARPAGPAGPDCLMPTSF